MSQAKTAETARYISKYLKLKIVMKGAYNQVAEGRVISMPGKKIVFDGGVYETTDAEEIAFIEARPEFGQIIIKAPNNVEDLAAARTEWNKDLEQREADLKAREEALKAKELQLTPEEEGKDDEEGNEPDGLEDLERKELLEILKKEKEADPDAFADVNGNSKNEDIIAAIRAKRDTEEDPAFTE